MKADLFLGVRCDLAEGPVWWKNELFWVDINPGLVHRYNPDTKIHRTYECGKRVGCLVPREKGGLMVALENGYASLDLESGSILQVVDPEAHLPANRFNDGKCDPQGRFWAGTLNMKGEKEQCAVYVLHPDSRVEQKITPVHLSNGLAWAPDGSTFYYIDTLSHEIAAFDFCGETGNISKRRAVVSVPKEMGYPDGMTIDQNGNLWVALWGGWAVVCWNPHTGEILDRIELPVSQVSCPTFAGSALDELVITSARTGLTPEQLEKEPEAGSLFRARPGVKGLPVSAFAG